MENVKGFDSDVARDTFIQMLKNENYNYQVSQLLNKSQFEINFT